jgi:hypothetical protein
LTSWSGLIELCSHIQYLTELDESLGDIHGLIVGKNPRLEKDHYNALKLSELF